MPDSIDFYGPNGHILRFENPSLVYPVNRYQSLWLATAAFHEATMWSAETQRPMQSMRALDLCCGGGAVAIALKSGGVGYVEASDVDERAVEACLNNAQLNNIALDRVCQRDWLGGGVDDSARFDFVACNPPCRPSSHCTEEFPQPIRTAIDGGPEGIDFMMRLIGDASGLLRDRGCLAFVVVSTVNFQKVRKALEDQFRGSWRLSYGSPVAQQFLPIKSNEAGGWLDAHRQRKVIVWKGDDGWIWRLSWVVVIRKMSEEDAVYAGNWWYRNHSYDVTCPEYVKAIDDFERMENWGETSNNS